MRTLATTRRLIRNLHTRKGRRRTGLTLFEGPRLVAEALAASVELEVVVIAEDFKAAGRIELLETSLSSRGVPLYALPRSEFEELATTDTPQGVLAVGALPVLTLEDVAWPDRVILVLDGIQDPGNAGALIRTAWALGARAVVSLEGSAAVSNPKVLRASMGGAFRMPVIESSGEPFLEWVGEQDGRIWIADTKGEVVTEMVIPERLALVVGNEGGGVTAAIVPHGEKKVAIPIAPAAESLNVAVAAGILLHEVMRDR